MTLSCHTDDTDHTDFYLCYLCYLCDLIQNSKINHSKFKIMATKKNMASTAKKRATIIAMAAIAGASVSQTTAAARQALHDMRNQGDLGHVYSVQYTWDPFDGMLA